MENKQRLESCLEWHCPWLPARSCLFGCLKFRYLSSNGNHDSFPNCTSTALEERNIFYLLVTQVPRHLCHTPPFAPGQGRSSALPTPRRSCWRVVCSFSFFRPCQPLTPPFQNKNSKEHVELKYSWEQTHPTEG